MDKFFCVANHENFQVSPCKKMLFLGIPKRKKAKENRRVGPEEGGGHDVKMEEGRPIPDVVWLRPDGTLMQPEDWDSGFHQLPVERESVKACMVHAREPKSKASAEGPTEAMPTAEAKPWEDIQPRPLASWTLTSRGASP